MKQVLLVLTATLVLWLVTLGGCTFESQTALAADTYTPQPPIEGAIWVQVLAEGKTFDAGTEIVHNDGKGLGGVMLWTENVSVQNAPSTKTLPNGGAWRVGQQYAITNDDGIINVWLLPQGGG